MTQRPPVITQIDLDSTGSLTITWSLDYFWDDIGDYSLPPEKVEIILNSDTIPMADPSKFSFTVSPDELKKYLGSQLTITVVFIWEDNSLQSSQVIDLTTFNPSNNPGLYPKLSVISINPKSIIESNNIKFHRSASNITSAEIIWWAISTPFSKETVPIQINSTNDYSGDWTTDVQLTSNTLYSFTLTVHNSFQSTSESCTIIVRSARNLTSLRSFLMANGINLPTWLRQHFPNNLPKPLSLNTLMGDWYRNE
jgi:hypothetical protein